jgi:exodeoxyribonuclease III
MPSRFDSCTRKLKMRATSRVVGRFYLVVLLCSGLVVATAGAADMVRVMTFNMQVGGESSGQPLEQITKLVKAARADLAGLQETHGDERNGIKHNAARAIAEQLGWEYFDQGNEDTGIISRYRIVEHTPKKWGVEVELPSGHRVWLFNAHFLYAPYQPYQLLKIPYDNSPPLETADQAVDSARKARGTQVAGLLEEVVGVRSEGTAIFVTGDFNEPSALDWTEPVFAAGRCPVPVRWPTTAALLDSGFLDTFREVHPDPLASPGNTWTPTTADNDPADRHDHIDFVLVSGPHTRVEQAEIVGENSDRANIVVTPYPSDHRGVVATFSLE